MEMSSFGPRTFCVQCTCSTAGLWSLIDEGEWPLGNKDQCEATPLFPAAPWSPGKSNRASRGGPLKYFTEGAEGTSVPRSWLL